MNGPEGAIFWGRGDKACEAQCTYIAINLKFLYASAECRERGFDPLDTNLVVADESWTDKTICLMVTPTLKPLVIPGHTFEKCMPSVMMRMYLQTVELTYWQIVNLIMCVPVSICVKLEELRKVHADAKERQDE